MCQIRATMIHECNFNKEEFMNDNLREELRSEIEDFRTLCPAGCHQLHAAASYESGGHDKGQAEIHM